MARKPSKTTLNNALDRLASIQVRERANGCCERCGQPATQVHHALSRRFRRLRWDRRNLVSICARCHRDAHDRPFAFVEWFKQTRPEDAVYIADPENSKPINRTVYELEDLREEMKRAA